MEGMNRRLDSILKSKKKLEETNAANSQNRRDLIIPHAAQNVHAHNPKKSFYGFKGKFTFLLMWCYKKCFWSWEFVLIL